MGLDMFLTAKRYFWCEEKNKYILEEIKKFFPDVDYKVESISFELKYWRKANAIHKWFVDNVQEGKDDCGTYYVSKKKLSLLLETITNVIDNPKLANELLPTESGFFFGDMSYDEFYFQNLKDTKEMLEKLLED